MLALSAAMMLAGCNPPDAVDTVRRDLPPPADICTEGVAITYPREGESWRTVGLRALKQAETIHGEKRACANWYKRLRERYAGGAK